MKGLFIPGQKMPECCDNCIANNDNWKCNVIEEYFDYDDMHEKRFDECPMIEVDADDLISKKEVLAEYDQKHVGPPGGARKIIAEATSPMLRRAAEVIHDAIDRTSFAEDAYPGIRETLHKAVNEYTDQQLLIRAVGAEIEEEYKKAVEKVYISKPLAYALHEVWKKHDSQDQKRNEKG